jgi:predicted phage terminase large subunit-like protein
MQLRADQERALLERKAGAKHEMVLREERKRQSNPNGGLLAFVRYFWSGLEPNRPLVEGKALEAIAEHLEAVTRGEIKRLLINVPPGFMKSMMVNVFWPAWEWSAAGLPGLRYVTFSYAAHLTERDNGKFRDLLRSFRFKELWGDAFALSEDGKIKVANDKTGWKFASSIKGVGTGERGDRVLWDDPHNIKEGESEPVREETVRWGREGMSNRLNDMDAGVIVVIMQRVHEEDVSGAIIEDDLGYVHLMIPMEYDASRHCKTSIGWSDWRTEDGELAWPERFSAATVALLKRTLGPYAYTGQYQQTPEPRGGGIFKRDWWRTYELDAKGKPMLPPHFMVASVDPAYTNKSENDPSGFTVWGVFRERDGHAKVALIYAWQKRLELHGQDVERKSGETEVSYLSRSKPLWGLVEWIAHDCKRMQVDLLLIESKASGLSVAQEIRRLYRSARWGVRTVDPGGLDKRARAYSVQHLFADGSIYAPDRDWADMVISEFAKFRGLPGDEDNLVDSGTQALKHLRDAGYLLRRDEALEDERDAAKYRRAPEPLYEA